MHAEKVISLRSHSHAPVIQKLQMSSDTEKQQNSKLGFWAHGFQISVSNDYKCPIISHVDVI